MQEATFKKNPLKYDFTRSPNVNFDYIVWIFALITFQYYNSWSVK